MIKFLRAAFHFTWFQVLLVVFFMSLKYAVTRFNIGDIIKTPLVWTCIAAFFSLLLSYGIIGIIENKGFSYETWEANGERSRKKALLIWFIKWSRIVPLLLGYSLFVYMVAPGSVSMLIALMAGIVIRNIFPFFVNKKASESVEAE